MLLFGRCGGIGQDFRNSASCQEFWQSVFVGRCKDGAITNFLTELSCGSLQGRSYHEFSDRVLWVAVGAELSRIFCKAPKILPKAPHKLTKAPQRPPPSPQRHPKAAQGPPKRPQRGPQGPPRGPKELPRDPQGGPNELPGAPQQATRAPRGHPKPPTISSREGLGRDR